MVSSPVSSTCLRYLYPAMPIGNKTSSSFLSAYPHVSMKVSFMALTRLPTELLEIIITHVLPEGFESVAVTCRKIYALCIPFFQRHNALRSRFLHFTYHENPNDPSPTIATAADLIRRIAVEPVVARYVRYANFRYDSPRGYPVSRVTQKSRNAEAQRAPPKFVCKSPLFT